MISLKDCKPHWINIPFAGEGVLLIIGVSFLCPHCRPAACPTCGNLPDHKRLAVSFWPPIDPDGWLKKGIEYPHEKFHHRISGETFETLTLSPSIMIEGHLHATLSGGRFT